MIPIKITDIRDLINRLQAEKTDLLGKIVAKNIVIDTLKAKINELTAENERLNDILDKKVVEFAYDKKQQIKAEAYKECIEKVKALFPSDNEPYQYWEIHEGADNILKELVGEDNA